MWRELITGLTEDAKFSPPASDGELERAAAGLGGDLPKHLAELLSESDGVKGKYGLGLIWPLKRIVSDNLHFRSSADFKELYMPFEPLLFFADAGNGDQFAFVWIPRRDEVFVWDHEQDSRRWVAPSLEMYLRWWLEGKLRI
jgi:hypothetical protein